MFRIDRSLVNLAAVRTAQVESDETSANAEVNAYSAASAATILELQREAIKQAEETAEQIIAEAKNAAAEILISAKEQAEDECREAWREGYAEGSAEGKRSTEEKYIQIYENKIIEDDQMLKRVINELYTERDATYASLESDIISLTLEIVKKILNPAEEAIGGVFVSLIRNALRQIAPEGKIVIRVSPAEFERFFASGSAYFELDKGVTVTAAVLKDSSLGEYDAIIDTEDETVNAGIDSQLKYIRISFNRAND